MKTINVSEAQGRLPQLVEEAFHGETIVLKDGDRAVTLYPGHMLDLEEDSAELAAELLKAAKGPFTPFVPEDLRADCEQVAREKRLG